MRTLILAIAYTTFAGMVFAQLDPYTLTVTASRPIAVQADQASLSIYVDTDPSAGLSDVLSLVQGVGLTQSNFSSVYTTAVYSNDPPYGSYPVLEWTFGQTISFSNLKNTLTNLGALQTKLGKQTSGPMLTFGVNGTQVSAQLQAAQVCPMAALIADARVQAQVLAQAAGFGLGQISTISDGSTGGVVGLGQSVAALTLAPNSPGAFFPGTGFFIRTPVFWGTCTIAAKFRLTLN